MHDFVDNLTPPKVSELFSYSSEKHYYCIRSTAAFPLASISFAILRVGIVRYVFLLLK